MADEIPKHLYDIQDAASWIFEFVRGKSFDDYRSDELLRSGVERKFEVIGEALNRLKRDDSAVLEHIREQRSIVSFRNILAHGYDTIDDRIVWSIIEEELTDLLDDVEKLIAEVNRPYDS
jgi:uncharacterized protein with HEPN domain